MPAPEMTQVTRVVRWLTELRNSSYPSVCRTFEASPNGTGAQVPAPLAGWLDALNVNARLCRRAKEMRCGRSVAVPC